MTLPRCFRYRGHKPRMHQRIFYNQDEAIERLVDTWECLRDFARDEGKKNWDGGKYELVLTRLPDAAICAEEQRDRKIAGGWDYEKVYGTAPPDTWSDEEGTALIRRKPIGPLDRV